MPYRWNDSAQTAPRISAHASHADGDAPLARLTLWPHRSLAPKGFVAVIALMFVLGLIPVLPLLGTTLIWMILIFTLGVLAALYFALQASYRHGLGEHLLIWSDHMELTRTNPKGPPKTWAANPYWVRIDLHKDGGPVEQYLTLKGANRQVELGAFLSPHERKQLRDDLAYVLDQLRDGGTT
ncbi:DUF2244 domain-containing protein [Aliiroseovarius sp. PTFE2010]|uniref:DUF2244 domain-containing protein n=1 Tax=Aliiroseovarius sp. PTFE2010 TaxID=3417190 RepID=UPI003CF77AB4